MQGTEAHICTICCEAYNQTDHRPIRLSCGHATCSTCFQYAYSDQAKVICGRCSTATFSSQQVPDYTVSRYMKALEVVCSKCGRNTATKYCREREEALCEMCVNSAGNCERVELTNEDFNLKHHLYKRIKSLKETLKPLLLSPFMGQIAQIAQLSNQQRLILLGKLLKAEMQQPCFLCQNSAAYFHTQSLTLCCAAHFASFPGAVELRKNNREDLMRQFKIFVQNFLATVSNSFFDPREAKMRSVFTTLKNPTITSLATILYRLNRMQVAQQDFAYTNLIQCPLCLEVFDFSNFPMVRLPCRNVCHFICQSCHTAHLSDLECPFDGSRFAATAFFTYQYHY